MTEFQNTIDALVHDISPDQARAMVAAYQAQKANILNGSCAGNPNILLDNDTFNLSAIQACIGQTGAAGFRIYMGLNSAGLITSVLVACDASGDDIIKNPACLLFVALDLANRKP